MFLRPSKHCFMRYGQGAISVPLSFELVKSDNYDLRHPKRCTTDDRDVRKLEQYYAMSEIIGCSEI